MKRSILFVLFQLIVLYSFSQETYPKKAVSDSDTVVIITVDQAKKINETFEDKRYYESLSDSLDSKCKTLEKKIENDSLQSGMKDEQIKDLIKISTNKDEIISRETKEKEEAQKKIKKSNGIIRFGSGILAGSVILNAILLLILFH